MSMFNHFLNILSASITVFIEFNTYSKLSRNKNMKISIRNILFVIATSLLIVINTYINDISIRPFLSFIIMYLASFVVFRDDLFKTFFNILLCHIFITLYEILLSSVILKLDIINYIDFEKNFLLKTTFSSIVLLLAYLTCSTSKVRNGLNNLTNKIKINKFLNNILIVFLISLIIIDLKYFSTLSNKIYLANIILLSCLIIFLITGINNYLRVQKEIEKSEVILNFMSKYEKIIDENRITRHEILNNLLILNSFKNKNTKEFSLLLNELIDSFNNKGIKMRNIYNLPPGLKGIFYYKLNGLDSKDYNININVSKNVISAFKKISNNDYTTISKMVTILLDNAIEACNLTTKKYLVVDLYKESNNIIIEITNSFKGKIDINKIYDRDYSTKGKNRGLGLFIIAKLLKSNEKIQLKQTVDKNLFCSKIIIKEK